MKKSIRKITCLNLFLLLLLNIFPINRIEAKSSPDSTGYNFIEKAFYPLNGKIQINPIIVKYKGIRHKPPIIVNKVIKELISFRTPLDSLTSSCSAFWNNDKDWVIKSFVPVDRQRVSNLFSNKDIFLKSVKVFKSFKNVMVTEELKYGKYSILLIKHELNDERISEFKSVFEETNAGWLKTNGLGRDPVWSYIIDSLQSAQVWGNNGGKNDQMENIKIFPTGSNIGDPIFLKFYGKIYNPPIPIVKINQKKIDLSSPIRTISAIYSLNKLGDKNLILNLFVPSERESIRKSLNESPNLTNKISWQTQQILKSTINKIIKYGNYAIVLTDNILLKSKNGQNKSTPIKISDWYILKKTNKGWLRTNDLKDDTFVNYLIGGSSIDMKIGPNLN